MFEYVDRQKGVQLAHNIYHHAKANNSNVGMYFATFALGTIREQSGNMGLAEKSFLQALKLKEEYLPEESAAPCYLGLCETALHRKDYEEVKEFARKALEEPGIIPMNKITAWSYLCDDDTCQGGGRRPLRLCPDRHVVFLCGRCQR